MRKVGTNKIIAFRQDPQFYFRIGVRYADKKKYGIAHKYLSKAVELEPYNADYLFNLAGVLAEMKEIEKSNGILLNILKNIDPTLTECYFGIACNYFEKDDLGKAKEYFEKYVYFDPEGSFADEVYDVLYYLQIYDDVGIDSNKNRLVVKLYNEGRKLLAKYDYKKACEKFEKAIEIDPEVTVPRNDLSLAYFLLGDTAKAISIANSVLKLDPGDVSANCNIAVFYMCLKNDGLYKKHLKILQGLELNEKEEVIKLLDTFIRFREYDLIKKIPLKFSRGISEAKEILREVLSGEGLQEEARAAILEVLEHECVNIEKNCKNSGVEDEKRTASTFVRWNKEWEEIINCAMQKKENTYKSSYRKELKEIWMSFIKSSGTECMPVIKKAEVWAAALEYIYCKLHYISVSKKKLADKYKVSESSITSKIKSIKQEDSG